MIRLGSRASRDLEKGRVFSVPMAVAGEDDFRRLLLRMLDSDDWWVILALSSKMGEETIAYIHQVYYGKHSSDFIVAYMDHPWCGPIAAGFFHKSRMNASQLLSLLRNIGYPDKVTLQSLEELNVVVPLEHPQAYELIDRFCVWMVYGLNPEP